MEKNNAMQENKGENNDESSEEISLEEASGDVLAGDGEEF